MFFFDRWQFVKSILSKMDPKTRRRQIAKEREKFCGWAKQQKCSPTQLAGLFIFLENYMTDKKVSELGWSIFNANCHTLTHEASIQEAMWLMERAKLSEAIYLEIRLRFLDRFVQPPVYKVAAASKQELPQLIPYRNGIRAPLKECLTLTLKQRLSILDLSGVQESILFSFSYGLDGSGQHQNFQQLSKSHFSKKQIMNVCFALKEISLPDGTVLWSSTEKGSNRPQNIRPLALFPEKESDGVLKDFVPLLDDEVESLKAVGPLISCSTDQQIKATVSTATMSMIDGKMVTRVLQLGGAYCTMCTLSCQDCHDEDIIASGFQITRSTNSLRDLALALEDPETGDISRVQNDYNIQSGLTAAPITSANVTEHIPVCHSKIRNFEWFVALMCRETVTENGVIFLHDKLTPQRRKKCSNMNTRI